MYNPGKIVGFVLAILGNTLIACSLTLQKSAHNAIKAASSSEEDRADEPPDALAAPCPPQADSDEESVARCESSSGPLRPSTAASVSASSAPRSQATTTAAMPPPNADAGSLGFLRSPTWWAGTGLMAAGEVGNFAAFAFAPASLVAPLGAWSVVLSAILAHSFLGEPTTRRNLYGIVLCVSGALLIGATGPDVSASEADLDAATVSALLVRPPFVLFIVLTLCAAGLLVALSHFTTLGHKYIFVYIGVSSLLGGVTVVCAKALSTFLRLTIQGNSQFGNWLPLALAMALILAIVAQLRYLNLAMSRFGNSQVVPVYYVLFTICAMSSGVIMYKEFDSLSLQNLPFFFGIAATMSGVFLVARESAADNAGYEKAVDCSLSSVESDMDWNHAALQNGGISERPRDDW